jgi:hypothetical protein
MIALYGAKRADYRFWLGIPYVAPWAADLKARQEFRDDLVNVLGSYMGLSERCPL